MISDIQRERVTDYRAQRERYMVARRQAMQESLVADRPLLSTSFRWLPVLLVTPFAMLAVAGALDLLFLVTGNGLWTATSFVLITFGVAGCFTTGAVGVRDWFALPAGSRARSVGSWFMIGVALVVGVFLLAWVPRYGSVVDPGGQGAVLGFMGSSVALLTGWLLGEYLGHLKAATLKSADRTSAAATPAPADLEIGNDASDQAAERRVANA